MKRMFSTHEFDPTKRKWKPNPKSDERVYLEVKKIFKKLPEGEAEWTHGKLQCEEDVAATFALLTLQSRSHETRGMDCQRILKGLDEVIDPECQLHVAFRGAAYQLLYQRRALKAVRIDDVIKSIERAAASNYIRFSDKVHRHQVLGNRAYEFLLHRESS